MTESPDNLTTESCVRPYTNATDTHGGGKRRPSYTTGAVAFVLLLIWGGLVSVQLLLAEVLA